jgi:hypothetical protein
LRKLLWFRQVAALVDCRNAAGGKASREKCDRQVAGNAMEHADRLPLAYVELSRASAHVSV